MAGLLKELIAELAAGMIVALPCFLFVMLPSIINNTYEIYKFKTDINFRKGYKSLWELKYIGPMKWNFKVILLQLLWTPFSIVIIMLVLGAFKYK